MNGSDPRENLALDKIIERTKAGDLKWARRTYGYQADFDKWYLRVDIIDGSVKLLLKSTPKSVTTVGTSPKALQLLEAIEYIPPDVEEWITSVLKDTK